MRIARSETRIDHAVHAGRLTRKELISMAKKKKAMKKMAKRKPAKRKAAKKSSKRKKRA